MNSPDRGIVVGFDVGTQGTKAIALDLQRGVVARSSVPYGLLEGLPLGAAEQHPDTWTDAVAEAYTALAIDPDDLLAVAVSPPPPSRPPSWRSRPVIPPRRSCG